ncbi:MAG TPA: nucleoside triphosphate pyrophosphatase [Pirellulales bacterium]|nr:nucleoside triphosphate pyrophosphatase [Pirellulales bacterium]
MPSSVPKLILASRSPRRRELLAEAGYQFEVVAPHENVECGVCSRESPAELVARLAYEKAANVAGRVGRGLILGCDTVAECDGQVLGKPPDIATARRMLQLLSGREHRVLSGLCLWNYPNQSPDTRVAVTKLRMDVLSDAQLDEYLQSYAWEGKAGAFGYQDRLGWVHVLEGSQSNVVGLPLELLAEMLARATAAERPIH